MNTYNQNYVKLFFVVLSIVGIVFFVYGFKQVFEPTDNFPTGVIFVIQKDETGAQIFADLQKQNFIKNIFWTKVFSRLFRKDKFYKGEYIFDTPVSTFEILTTITSKPVSLAVLIPEGFTKKQIAERLQKYIIHFDKNDFLKNSVEGYLFPDTYYFYKFSTNAEILKEFNTKFNQNMLENFGKIPTKNQIIIASMLEREARDGEDMKIISGIIQNRLKINMALQIDATVLYGNGIWKDRVFYKDLKTRSAYNTYLNTGLPPGAISNPGINALRAAIFPAKTKYFYYLTGSDGKMHYAITHEEHILNKQKYLR